MISTLKVRYTTYFHELTIPRLVRWRSHRAGIVRLHGGDEYYLANEPDSEPLAGRMEGTGKKRADLKKLGVKHLAAHINASDHVRRALRRIIYENFTARTCRVRFCGSRSVDVDLVVLGGVRNQTAHGQTL